MGALEDSVKLAAVSSVAVGFVAFAAVTIVVALKYVVDAVAALQLVVAAVVEFAAVGTFAVVED